MKITQSDDFNDFIGITNEGRFGVKPLLTERGSQTMFRNKDHEVFYQRGIADIFETIGN
jgi:hypothetical protein